MNLINDLGLGLFLIFVSWCAYWGTVGVLAARWRNASAAYGASTSILFGPIGFAVMMWTTRVHAGDAEMRLLDPDPTRAAVREGPEDEDESEVLPL